MTGKTKIHNTGVRFLSSLLVPFLLLGLLAGCSIPIGVTRVSTGESYRQSTANPLNEGVPSTATRVVLQRHDLTSAFSDDPVKAIRFLNETAKVDERRDLLFALAELSYLHGERLKGSNSSDDKAHAPDYFLLSASMPISTSLATARSRRHRPGTSGSGRRATFTTAPLAKVSRLTKAVP